MPSLYERLRELSDDLRAVCYTDEARTLDGIADAIASERPQSVESCSCQTIIDTEGDRTFVRCGYCAGRLQRPQRPEGGRELPPPGMEHVRGGHWVEPISETRCQHGIARVDPCVLCDALALGF